MLGSSLVRVLCARGTPVVAGFWRDADRAEQLQRETGCGLQRGDITDETEVNRIFTGSKFSAVVHCAGVNHDCLLVRESPAGWAESLNSHATSAFLVTRAGLQVLPPGGQLILVASRVGERGGTGQCAYAAAKGAVLGLMRAAAREGAARQVSVNAICPGFAPSPLSSQISSAMLTKRQGENLLEGSDAAEAFAGLVAWLLEKPRGTGQIYRPDCRG